MEVDHKFMIGRLGASRNLGRSFYLAMETEMCLNNHSDEVKIGSSILWHGENFWVLSGLLFDMHSESNIAGPALQFQAGIPF